MQKTEQMTGKRIQNFGRLIFFECKKILQKKLVWITTAVMLLIIGITVSSELIGDYWVNGEVVDSNYNQFKTDQAYAKALDGAAVNQELLDKTFEGYGKIPENNLSVPYSVTEEYQKYARPYSPVFGLARSMTKMNVDDMLLQKPEEGELYALWQEMLDREWDDHYLSAEEIQYWEEQKEQLVIPFTYYYTEGYFILFRVLLTMGLITMLSVSICLADIFPREHTRRTDQLNLAAKNGKSLYFAKLLAGILVAAVISLLFSAEAVGLTFLLYGAEGFGAPLQLIMPECAYPISVGRAMLIAYALLIVIGIFWGVFVMMLSEMCRSNIAALAITNGLLLLSMFLNIPEEYRVVSQIWGYFPGAEILSYWGVFEPRLVPFFGGYLTKWQFALLLYGAVGAVFLLFGKLAYGRRK